jgi:hypothetical protein
MFKPATGAVVEVNSIVVPCLQTGQEIDGLFKVQTDICIFDSVKAAALVIREIACLIVFIKQIIL